MRNYILADHERVLLAYCLDKSPKGGYESVWFMTELVAGLNHLLTKNRSPVRLEAGVNRSRVQGLVIHHEGQKHFLEMVFPSSSSFRILSQKYCLHVDNGTETILQAIATEIETVIRIASRREVVRIPPAPASFKHRTML